MARDHATDIDASGNSERRKKRNGRALLMIAVVAAFVLMLGAYTLFATAMADQVPGMTATGITGSAHPERGAELAAADR